jgi:hypothetical protein
VSPLLSRLVPLCLVSCSTIVTPPSDKETYKSQFARVVAQIKHPLAILVNKIKRRFEHWKSTKKIGSGNGVKKLERDIIGRFRAFSDVTSDLGSLMEIRGHN